MHGCRNKPIASDTLHRSLGSLAHCSSAHLFQCALQLLRDLHHLADGGLECSQGGAQALGSLSVAASRHVTKHCVGHPQCSHAASALQSPHVSKALGTKHHQRNHANKERLWRANAHEGHLRRLHASQEGTTTSGRGVWRTSHARAAAISRHTPSSASCPPRR